MSSRIGVYSGKGAEPFFTEELQKRLNEIVDDRQHQLFSFTSFNSLCEDQNPSSIQAVYIPGGNAGYLMGSHLGGAWKASDVDTALPKHCKNVNDFFMHFGISMYGIGAGAIYGSSVFHRHISEDIYDCTPSVRNRYVGLFPGGTVSPLYPLQGEVVDNIYPIENFHVKNINVRMDGVERKVAVPIVLGVGMLNAHHYVDTEILSTFEDPPKINLGIKSGSKIVRAHTELCQDAFASVFYHGKTQMILDGCHLEIQSTSIGTDLFRANFNGTKQQIQTLSKELSIDDVARRAIFTQNSERIGVKTKPL